MLSPRRVRGGQTLNQLIDQATFIRGHLIGQLHQTLISQRMHGKLQTDPLSDHRSPGNRTAILSHAASLSAQGHCAQSV
jgi:hypothetical protein